MKTDKNYNRGTESCCFCVCCSCKIKKHGKLQIIMSQAKIFHIIPLLFLILLASHLDCNAGDNPFPHYKVLEPNVAFWKKVYSEYSYNQSIIHDKSNPMLIYTVLDFEDSSSPYARKARRKREKAVCRKYSHILRGLASGRQPVTSEERKVAALFGSNPDVRRLRQAADGIRCQRGQKDRFLQGVERSGAYIDAMKELFRSYGLPEELCYLPHVESSFRHWARSKCGAAGMWQFMRGTARRFITVNYLVDERLDPMVSTRAAAELLLDNYQKLGTWPLAITAYNHGAAGMERALRQKGSFEKIVAEYRGRRFKFASRNFYAEFLAAKEVAENYRRNPQGIQYHAPMQAVTVHMPSYISFADLSAMLNVPPSELHELNPALRRPILSGEKYIPKGYGVRVPLLDSSSFALALLPGEDTAIFKTCQKMGRHYRVRRGDTAHKIARRHGVSLKRLAAANGLDSRYRIYAGQTLRLPF
jgi:membrane-bound lytic murein transglycosylase D